VRQHKLSIYSIHYLVQLWDYSHLFICITCCCFIN